MKARRLVFAGITLVTVVLIGLNVFAQDNFVGEGEYTFSPMLDEMVERPLFYGEFPDDTGRRFVMEQRGVIHLVVDGVVQPEPFLDITRLADDSGNEQGLLGFAFDPNFAENGYFYVDYTRTGGDTIIARYQVDMENPNQADPDSALQILYVDQPYANHNGGMLAFGADGYLYIAFGDGGSQGDPNDNGQDTHALLAKILRIDVSASTAEEPYTIPADNPFADGVDGRGEVWLYGLRNPWRFSFDTATEDLYIGDVGANRYEEIDYIPAGTSGLNLGWSVYGGTHEMEQGVSIEGTIMPIAEYTHDEGCSVTGGYVYRGELHPELDGTYFYGDYCSGIIWSLKQDENGEWINEYFLDTDFLISSFAQDLAGELYVVDQTGMVYQLVKAEEE